MRVPVGVSDFKELIQDVSSQDDHYLYCDKTLMIKNVIDDGAKVLLFTRPRRFGKTLNMSMLSYFFGTKEPLFDGLEISKNQHIMDTYQGQYPVIFMSFKGLKHAKYEDMFEGITTLIRRAFADHQKTFDVHSSQFSIYFDHAKPLSLVNITNSLLQLSEHLHAYYGRRVLILIDEYDAPIQTGYLNDYYEEIVALMRNLFEDGLKDNGSLYKGVLTGITRIAKENLFSGLNHLRTCDIDQDDYAEYFGFTEEEVISFCPKEYIPTVKEWYNGYSFGTRRKLIIYNPWSVLTFIQSGFLEALYWINTSSNELVQQSLTAEKMADVEALISGHTVLLKVDSSTIFKYLKNSKNSFLNLLYSSGYLTSAGEALRFDEKFVRIPNREVQEFFETIVMKWFSRGNSTEFLQDFLAALLAGAIEKVQIYLSTIILESFSFHDVDVLKQESFYHGFLLGITLGLKGRYHVNSNRESGYGRYDIALYPNDPTKDPGVIIEVKMNKESADDAILQIQDKAYATELIRHGCKTVFLYGLHFDGKTVSTKMVRLKTYSEC